MAHPKKDILLRLHSLGAESPWQIPLIIPRYYLDLRKPRLLSGIVAQEHENSAILLARIMERPKWDHSAKPPYGMMKCHDARRTAFNVMIYGSPWRWKNFDLAAGNAWILEGKVRKKSNQEYSLSLSRIFPLSYAGKFIPVYPASDLVSSEELLEYLNVHFDELIDTTVQKIECKLPDDWQKILSTPRTLREIFTAVHFPKDETDLECLDLLKKIDVLILIEETIEQLKKLPSREPLSFDEHHIETRINQLPFTLTADQKTAIKETLDDLKSNRPMRRLLTGDVGSGKTICYLMACAATAMAGRRAAVILPNVVLAEQVYQECKTFFPDIECALRISGKTKGNLDTASIVIGTSALLHKKESIKNADLIVIDEQQRFSKFQREGKIHEEDTDESFDESAHLIEVSATPIPRSLAIANLGLTDVSKLSMPHANKKIETRLWDEQTKKDLFLHLIERVNQGEQIAIIYPLKEANEEQSNIRDVIQAAQKWEKLFPGKVRLLHGNLSAEEKNQVIQDMKNGAAKILVSTTVIEVGVTIPNLTTMAVIDAHKFGLSQLHQLRGRLVRHGGTGYYDLFVSNLSDAIAARLDILTKTNNGFEIAQADLELRGQGELNKEIQSGTAYGMLLPPRKSLTGITFKMIDELLKNMDAQKQRNVTKKQHFFEEKSPIQPSFDLQF